MLKTKFGAFDSKGSLHCSLLLDCNKCQSTHNRIAVGLTPTKLNHGEIQFKYFNIN